MPLHLKWRRRQQGATGRKPGFAERLTAALDRNLAAPPSKVTTFAEMSPEKQAELRRLYEKKGDGE